MKVNHFKDVVRLCESSSLNYFKYVSEGEEIVFSKSKELLEYDTESKILSANCPPVDEQASIRVCDSPLEENTVIKSPHIGIIHLDMLIPNDNSEDEIVVKKGETLCTIEAMKLYNNVESPVSGIVVKVLVEEGAQVEYGQPLFEVKENEYEENK